jgi:hypothetical protein
MTSKELSLVGLALALPVATVLALPRLPALGPPRPVTSAGDTFPASPLRFERQPLPVANEEKQLPLVTNVQVVDLDGDGTAEVLACDALGHRVVRFDRAGDRWKDSTLVDLVAYPAHVTAVDIDGDGDQDLVVSTLGDLIPSDAVIGQVILFEKRGDGYERHLLLDDVRRVADVQPGDFDGDGDVDLAVAVFGYSRGEVLWLENRGDFVFADHVLLSGPGAIHVPVADYDGDGDLDIATIMSQDLEELWGFENRGNGSFRRTMLWRTPNYDMGSAGLVASDLDQDGDVDLILPVGDNLEDFDAFPQPYHGCLWFENEGGWQFVERRIATLGGTYAAAVDDLDGDGDRDVVLASMTNDWTNPANASLVWLENDGKQSFRTWQIDNDPIHLVTVAAGDIDGDGRPDLVAGGLNLRRPYQRIGGTTAWLNRGLASWGLAGGEMAGGETAGGETAGGATGRGPQAGAIPAASAPASDAGGAR